MRDAVLRRSHAERRAVLQAARCASARAPSAAIDIFADILFQPLFACAC